MATLKTLLEARKELIGKRKKLRISNPDGAPRNIENRLNQDIKRLDRELANVPTPKKKDPLA